MRCRAGEVVSIRRRVMRHTAGRRSWRAVRAYVVGSLFGAGMLSTVGACAVHATHDGRRTVQHAPAHQRDGGGATPSMSTPRSTSPAAGVIIADGHGWTTHGVDGPVPAAGTCHFSAAANGEQLSDPRCTPGAIDRAATTTNLRSTLCRPGGYTASVRPPRRITTAAKRTVMAAYGVPWSQARHYELDHLIALSAGGASDVRNLWPQRNTLRLYHGSTYVHNDKDQVEAVVHGGLCAGTVGLSAAQAAIATDWTTALHQLHLPATAQTR